MGLISIFKERYLVDREYVRARLMDTFWTILNWLPVLVVGGLCFFFATSMIPDGTILDFRIKLLMYLGKVLMALFFGQIFWQLLFPSLHTKIFAKKIEYIQPKDYNVMYGRIVFHAIMQFTIMNL